MWLYILIAMLAFSLIGGYVFSSLLLMRYPSILHRRKKIKFKCRHISHRGGAGENLENTMTAFKFAADVTGTDMLEIDCHATKDGQVVVSHDDNLLRSTGRDVLISKTNYQDLPPLKACMKVDFYPDHSISAGDDRRIPLLADVFKAFPHLPINIDIKVDNDVLIQKNPNIHLLSSLRRVIWIVVMFVTGLLPFVPMKEDFFEVIMPSILSRMMPPHEISRWHKFLIDLSEKVLINKTLFKHLERRGIQVYIWVLNDEAEYDRAFKAGATGVMTDFPTKLKRYLEEHPEYQLKPNEHL
ncbi:lysophospholipase D GDPD1-like isoform X3 [Tubulanus polymorphus]|uniref:lysophospholipase D GDPD1-like isoform X3 n=1 Tax=Tubulanus polymorphus TaxID=672921 RepID=UPI003DA38D52